MLAFCWHVDAIRVDIISLIASVTGSQLFLPVSSGKITTFLHAGLHAGRAVSQEPDHNCNTLGERDPDATGA